MKNNPQYLNRLINLIKDIYKEKNIQLHRPILNKNDQKFLVDCVKSNYVSSVGMYVNDFEKKISDITGAKYTIATVNGTSALHIAMITCGIERNNEVLTQSVTFVGTCNAISYIKAHPIFIDVDKDTMSMSPLSLKKFLNENAKKIKNLTYNKKTGRVIRACLPVHTFGFPARIREIKKICKEWNIKLIEDAAESLGSYIGKKHTGTYGDISAISFNGNKIITTGGGGMVLTNNRNYAERARHLSTTARIKQGYEYIHDEIGYNYRLPNINAALGCSQVSMLDEFLEAKLLIHEIYARFMELNNISFLSERKGTKSNNWLFAMIASNEDEKKMVLDTTNKKSIMTRPLWKLMHKLPMYKNAIKAQLPNSIWLEDRVINLPSSVPINYNKKILESIKNEIT
jgi:perosamine synthetase